MAKKQLTKKYISNTRIKQILWMAALLAAAFLAIFSWHIVKVPSGSSNAPRNSIQQPATEAEKERMQAYVNDIEQRRYRYPVIDVKENRVYFPEARMYVPLSENSRDIRYQGSGEKLWLSTSMAVGRQTGDADASCDRVVILTKSETDGRGYIAAGTIKSDDGSIRYIFRHPACRIYSDASSQSLANVVKEIQYY